MAILSRRLTATFNDFFDSERSAGILLIICTALALLVANSYFRIYYVEFLHANAGGLTVEQWINDGLMAVFFLLIGLELEREFYSGELSNLKGALLPILAALGGIAVPALIHLGFNYGKDTQAGIGIPMATDIAFAIGVIALVGDRVPASLKVFLAALAVIDDLGAIIVIAVFYSGGVSVLYLAGALAVFGALIALNRFFGIMKLWPYLAGGILMWFLMLRSGVHPTISGVLLAFTIPFSRKDNDDSSPSYRLEHFLQKPAAFLVLPVFALANAGIVVDSGWAAALTTSNSAGIILGLLIGKPIGITLTCLICVALKLCSMPPDLKARHIIGAGFLGGIGFTMSIFITNLAFSDRPELINSSKLAILLTSLAAGLAGFAWLWFFSTPAGGGDQSTGSASR